jgi:hypothetical protein
MADHDTPESAEDEPEAAHHEGVGGRLHHAEHSVEEALRDAVARVENRVIQAGEAETSASPEVNFASAIEVALNPPHATADDDEPDPATAEAPAPGATPEATRVEGDKPQA